MRDVGSFVLALLGVLIMGAGLGGALRWAVDTSAARMPVPQVQIRSSGEVLSDQGHFVLSWHPVGGDVVYNQPFAVEMSVQAVKEATGAPLTLTFDCRMPDHGHGMNDDNRKCSWRRTLSD